jgi:DNA-binding transcriptional LysR family regulator
LFSEQGLNYNLTMEVVGRDAIKTYVGMNLGISIINEYYISSDDRRNLFVYNLSPILGRAEAGIITRKSSSSSKVREKFVDLVLQRGAN